MFTGSVASLDPHSDTEDNEERMSVEQERYLCHKHPNTGRGIEDEDLQCYAHENECVIAPRRGMVQVV